MREKEGRPSERASEYNERREREVEEERERSRSAAAGRAGEGEGGRLRGGGRGARGGLSSAERAARRGEAWSK